MLVRWTDKLAVGIESIDRDHKILFDLVNQFHDAYAQGKTGDSLRYVFETLIDYTDRHFKDEEDLMFRHGYPGADKHQRGHHVIRDELEGLHYRYERGEQAEVCLELLGLMNNWLRFHIMESDLGYKKYFDARGIVP